LWLARFGLTSFSLGAIAGVSTSYSATMKSTRTRQALAAFLSAGLCEELFKLLFPGILPRLMHLAEHRRSLWLLPIVSALGFTTVENVLYFTMSSDVMLLYVRSFLVIPLHASWNFIACSGLVQLHISRMWPLKVMLPLVVAVLLHGSYDYCIYAQMSGAFFFVNVVSSVLIASMLWGIRSTSEDSYRLKSIGRSKVVYQRVRHQKWIDNCHRISSSKEQWNV